MKRRIVACALVIAVAPATALTGCIVTGDCVDLIDPVTESRAIELGDAESVEVFLDTKIGNFVVQGGASGLMDAVFTYNIEEWKPSVDYDESGSKGVLTLRQPDLKSKNVPNEARNEWDISLTGDVPVSIFLDSSVSEVRLDLSGVILDRLDVDQGVGSVKIDLGPQISRDADVNIEGGIGEVVLTLPEAVGIRVDSEMGLGSFEAPGLFRRGGAYVNDAYGTAEISVEVEINAGIGSVKVKVGARGSAAV